MEALQCVKCAIRYDLLFKESAPLLTLEAEISTEDDDDTGGEGFEIAEFWDDFLIEDDRSEINVEFNVAELILY